MTKKQTEMQSTMNRNDFLRKVIRAGLLMLLAFIAYALKSRIVTDPACTSCPEQGGCVGRQQCIKN